MNIQLPPLTQLQQLLPPRAIDAHKGDFGTVLVVGGTLGMSGAPLMAAMAAQRSGAGKVIIATDVAHAHTLVNAWPSLMAYGIKTGSDLQALLARATHVLIGPGLGMSPWADELWAAVLRSDLPMVVDADALNKLSQLPFMREHWILTPHMGEAARLLNIPIAEIIKDREKAARALQKKYGGIIILKGAHTLIADATHIWECHAGNPGMATAGMGDILSGVIAALLAQGLSLSDAAKLAVSLHAHAGDLAATQGMRGMIATDLLPFIRQLVNI